MLYDTMVSLFLQFEQVAEFNIFEVWLEVIDKNGRAHFTNVQNLLPRSHRIRRLERCGFHCCERNIISTALKVYWRVLDRIKKKFCHYSIYCFPWDRSDFWVNWYFNKLDPVGIERKHSFLLHSLKSFPFSNIKVKHWM